MIEQIKQKKYYRDVFTIILLMITSFFQVFVIKSIVTPANLLPAGFMGISVLIQRLSEPFIPGGLPLSISSLLLNIPVALLCFKGLSPRFAIYSLFQVFFSSFLLATLKFTPIINDTMLCVILGGVLSGLYITLALYADASTGGTDFIALYVSNKRGKSIWEYVFVFNVMLLLIFGAIRGWEQAGYSILYQFISTKTIENFHHRYEQVTVQITTVIPEKVMDYYFEHYRHGMSCMEAVGGYTHKKIYVLNTVISSYELKEVTSGILMIDPKAIINVMKTQQFFGNFYRKGH
ncbi:MULTISPECIES: YitT family protein [unclassified Granulicatella]|uniref:YitT family protein n=1 Tax=unclassified Granulicatella TaxID=2630493 RepID=UPI001072FBB0|nr:MULTISPECIES: YitT family protein [unclassified Granulicatella]MBF0780817.1 YitT family protein [Granulicatella sp. 19428wC4_WM01]TFU93803.1 YitT family protein [Granulicatella sp. WM01]